MVNLTVTDGNGQKAYAALYSLAVDPALTAGTVSATHNPVDAQVSTTISTTGGTGGSGTGTYTYFWSGLPPGCPTPGNVVSFACTPSAGSQGSYTVAVDVVDANGNVAYASTALVVLADPTVSVAPAGPLTYDVGQTASTLKATVSYSGSNTVTISWYSSTSISCSSASTGPLGSGTTFVPSTSSAGTTYYCAVVTDSAIPGYTSASNPVAVVVSPLFLSGVLLASPNPTDVGEPTVIYIAAGFSGGAAPYSIVWTGVPPGCAASGSGFGCYPDLAGSYTITVTVTDANGATASASTVLVVDPALSAGTVSATPNPVDVGQATTISTTGATGGSGGGTYTYVWSGLPSGCAVPGNVTSFKCTPTGSGSAAVTLTVYDTNGNSYSTYFQLTVNNDPGVSVSPSGPFYYDQGQTASALTATLYYLGTNAVTITWYSSGSPCPPTTTPTGVTGATYTPPTTAVGLTWYCAVVTDSGVPGYSYISNSVPVVVLAPPVASIPAISSLAVDAGQTVEFYSTPSSGSGSYYSWAWENLPAGAICSSLLTDPIFCTIPAGTYTLDVSAQVTDTLGGVSAWSSPLTSKLVVSPALTLSALSATRTSLDVGQSLTFSVTVSGGAPGTDTISWSGLPTGCNAVSATTIGPCAPSSSGLYGVSVQVTDLNGAVATIGPLAISVYPDPAIVGPFYAQNPVTFNTITSADVGETFLVNSSEIYDALVPPFTITWSGNPTGCTPAGEWLSCSIATPGSLNLVLTEQLTDGNGNTTTFTGAFDLLINPDPVISAPVLTVNGQPATQVDWGVGFTLTTTVVNPGSGIVSYSWSDLSCFSATCSTAWYGELGVFTITVNATDSDGMVASVTFALQVVNDVSVGHPTASIATPDVGQTVTFGGSIANGTAPYTISWFPEDLPAGCPFYTTTTSAATFSFSCTVTATGLTFLAYQVTDAQGDTAYSTDVTMFVNPDPVAGGIGEANYTAYGVVAVTSLDVGEPLTFLSDATLGTGTYTFAWTGLPSGTGVSCSGTLTAYPSCAWSAPTTATFTVSYTVTDSDGVSATSAATTTTLIVHADPVASSISVLVNGQDRTVGDRGENVTFSLAVGNPGSGGLQYAWYGTPCGSRSLASFACVISGGAGTYHVSAYITDSNGWSPAPATLTFQVAYDPYIPIGPVYSTGTADVGQTVWLWWYIAYNGEYSTAPPTWTVTGEPTQCGAAQSWANNTGDYDAYVYVQLPCTWSSPGTYTNTVTVNATDDSGYNWSQGLTSTNSVSVVVSSPPAISAITATIQLGTGSAVSNSADVYQAGWFNATVLAPGAGGDTFTWTGLPYDCYVPNNAVPSAYCPGFYSPGTYTVTVNITDQNGKSVQSTSLTFTVYHDPDAYTTLTRDSLDVGQTVSFSATVTNPGSGGDVVAWSNVPAAAFCVEAATLLNWTCTPASAGTFSQTIYFNVTDSNGVVDTVGVGFYVTVYTDAAVSKITDPGSVDVGQTVTFSATPGGGSGSYVQYNWSGLPATALCNGGVDHTSGSSITCTMQVSGTYALNVGVTVEDSNGYTSRAFTAPLTVVVMPDPAVSQPVSSIQSPDYGQTVTLTSTLVNAGNGTDVYLWHNLPGGCAASSSLTVTCLLTSTGWYYPYVEVTDSNHWSSYSSELSMYINGDPAIGSVSTSTSHVDVGQSFYLYPSVSSGTGVYNYTWTTLPGWCTSPAMNKYSARPTCTAASEGVVNLTTVLTVRDSAGFNISGTFTTSIVVSADPMLSLPTSSAASIDYGQTVTFSSTVLDPGSGVSSIAWSGAPGACPNNALTNGPCAPSTGTYDIYVKVTDTNGYSSEAGPLVFTVFSDPYAYGPYLSGSGYADVGQTGAINASPAGGTGTYTYTWNGLAAAGCSPTTGPSAKCTWDAAGTYTVTYSATDSNGVTSLVSSPLVFVVSPDPTVAKPTPNVLALDQGQTLTFNTTASGGTAPYETYLWYGFPLDYCSGTGVSGSGGGSDLSGPYGPVLICYDVPAGTYTVTAVVIDGAGFQSAPSPGVTVTINPDLSVTPPAASIDAADVGQTVTLSATPSGGTGTYAWSWAGLPPTGCTGTTTAVVTCVVSGAGTYYVTATVTDKAGLAATSSATPLVVNLPLKATATGGNTSAGSVGTFGVTVQGGTGPYTVTWNFGDGASASSSSKHNLTGWQSQLSFTTNHTYGISGTYTVTVTVQDAAGQTSVSTYTVHVSSVSSGVSGQQILEYVLIAVVVVLAVVLIWLLVVRRRRSPTPPKPYTATEGESSQTAGGPSTGSSGGSP